jgi:pyrimidine-nucleoside phosphorylase
LEAIPGFKTDLPVEEFKAIVNDIGIAIVGQNAELAPADKLLYALRDVTATVDSLPLIVSSIMGKKLAADDDCIVLDVKTGSGSFMKTPEKSRELAEWMVAIGQKAGKRMRALITDMDRPLGYAIGNSLEVVEAVRTLQGKGPEDLTELCVALAAHILELAEKGDYPACEKMVRAAIADGTGLKMLAEMVKAQGGNAEWILQPELFPTAKFAREVKACEDGYIVGVDTEGYGVASLLLGAGRNTKEDVIDFAAGIMLKAKTGDFVKKGDVIAVLYSDKQDGFENAEKRLLAATRIGAKQPKSQPLILDVVQ